MITSENISIVLQIATLGGIIFAIYTYFRNPQEKSEMNDALFNERLDNMKDLFINLRDNHIHALETKLDQHIADNHAFVEQDIKWKSRIETLLENK